MATNHATNASSQETRIKYAKATRWRLTVGIVCGGAVIAGGMEVAVWLRPATHSPGSGAAGAVLAYGACLLVVWLQGRDGKRIQGDVRVACLDVSQEDWDHLPESVRVELRRTYDAACAHAALTVQEAWRREARKAVRLNKAAGA